MEVVYGLSVGTKISDLVWHNGCYSCIITLHASHLKAKYVKLVAVRHILSITKCRPKNPVFISIL